MAIDIESGISWDPPESWGRITTIDAHTAVIPEVEGTASITGRHEFLIDPVNVLGEGFIPR